MNRSGVIQENISWHIGCRCRFVFEIAFFSRGKTSRKDTILTVCGVMLRFLQSYEGRRITITSRTCMAMNTRLSISTANNKRRINPGHGIWGELACAMFRMRDRSQDCISEFSVGSCAGTFTHGSCIEFVHLRLTRRCKTQLGIIHRAPFEQQCHVSSCSPQILPRIRGRTRANFRGHLRSVPLGWGIHDAVTGCLRLDVCVCIRVCIYANTWRHRTTLKTPQRLPICAEPPGQK
jgi:hypothetical protein